MRNYAKDPDLNSASLRFIHRDDMEAEGYGAYLSQVEEKDND